MAGGVFSGAKLNGMTIRESATDGSDFSNPDADYRRLFLGEDGALHLKDSAGTVTDIGGGGGGIPEVQKAARTAGDLTTTSTSFVDVTDMSITLTTAAVRVMVFFNGSCKNDGNNTNTAFTIDIDGANQGGTYGLAVASQGSTDASHATPVAITFVSEVLTAASHTIKVQWRVDGGTGTLFASSGVTPARLTVIELPV